MGNKTLEQLRKEALAESKKEAKMEEQRLQESIKKEEEEAKQELKREKEQKKEEQKKEKASVKKEEKKKTTVAKSPIKKVEAKAPKIDPKIQSKRASTTKVELTDKEKLEDAKIKLRAVMGMIEAFPLNSCYVKVKNQIEKRVQKLESKLKTRKK